MGGSQSVRLEIPHLLFVLLSKTALLLAFLSVGGSHSVRLEIPHLLLADGTIIFCDNECEQIIYLCCILVWFEVVSGLRVHLTKAFVLLVGEVDNAHWLTSMDSKCGRTATKRPH